MDIFVIEINGVAAIAFNADNLFQAKRIAERPGLRSDLMVNQTDTGPIWNGHDDVLVRQAQTNERSLWERTRAFAMSDRTNEELGTLEIWLVNVINRTDDEARRRPLH